MVTGSTNSPPKPYHNQQKQQHQTNRSNSECLIVRSNPISKFPHFSSTSSASLQSTMIARHPIRMESDRCNDTDNLNANKITGDGIETGINNLELDCGNITSVNTNQQQHQQLQQQQQQTSARHRQSSTLFNRQSFLVSLRAAVLLLPLYGLHYLFVVYRPKIEYEID